MSKRKTGLGRNLNVLLSNAPAMAVQTEGNQNNKIYHLPIKTIQPGSYQPRGKINEEDLKGLAESIKKQGIIQPIIVRRGSNQSYEIIAGERRWRAAQIAGLSEIPALVREMTDESTLAVALIENIQREDLNAMEEAQALHRLLAEFNLTHQQVAEAVGKSRTTVTNLLRLMDLDDAVKKMLVDGDLEMGHARALLALEHRAQVQAAQHIKHKGLSVRETESLVRKLQQGMTDNNPTTVDPNISALQNKLAEKLGAKVLLQQAQQGKGKLIIHYNSLDELDGIIEHIR